MGRPRKDINLDELEKLASLQCTYEELAAFFDCDKSTLSKNKDYSTRIAKGREKGKMSLRRSQFKLAERNAAMAIWLGKQYLGQRENTADNFENNGASDFYKRFIDRVHS